VTASSGKEAPSDVVIHSAKYGTKGGKKRCKQHPQGATTMTNHDNNNYGKASGSSRRCITMAAHGNKHLARSPTDHFRRLLEVACPDHVYPIRHKLEDYDMTKIFMISGSFTQGIELNKDPGGSDTMPFHEEDTVMTV
jgi:hypothetical protein